MRLLLELAVVAALIAFGWSKSYSERIGIAPAPAVGTKKLEVAPPPVARVAVTPATASQPAPTNAPALAIASPTPNNAWMWDPNRQGSLDRKGTPQPKRP